ncbi:NusA-like transcription termination signal-binding factor [Methanonatronarchaeum sp. AMET6-2]|uniref:NusA-like transcription termination signal-binding factor n=1 Tax=Methanonatronarchaeum sp. AMET6-2 TaxID=2933293 RepID=UPI00120E3C8A|nr:NusA-like transcription termination signal-binding factor [Methanonatronarchaeum sp. AMET6-2]RZN60968.1 MAG: NusA-like transcription termination signal-binding factor [Methanonatronarchaeia archaeon]UOY10662.1 NusA-like transcription termination signal-binding factor [Methanonatronarchaeum sp. AMET6-2]
MSEVKLSSDEIRYIALFESLTGAGARDCYVDDENDRVIFVVNQGEMGLAIGKGGRNIKRFRETVGKRVEVVEYAEEPEAFIKNALSPAEVEEVDITNGEEGKKAEIDVKESKKGLVIGKNGRNIEKAKLLADRHYNINDIILL